MVTFQQARQIVLNSWPDYELAEYGYEDDKYWFLILLPLTAGGRIPAVTKVAGAIEWINENAKIYTQEHPVGDRGAPVPSAKRYNPDQPRDKHGRFGQGGGGVSTIADSPLVSARPLGGGMTASVSVEEHETGTIVRKSFPDDDSIRAPDKAVDAEVLSSHVAAALGVRSPEVVKVDDNTVIMTHIEGTTRAETSRSTSLPDEIADSDEGRMIGLHDVLTGNRDRNAGNFMTTPDGHLVAIDHGLAFGWTPDAGTGSPFARGFTNEAGNNWAEHIDYSPSDMATVRQRLTDLRPEFEAAGRGDWHDQIMKRMDALEPRANGTVNRLP